MCLVGGLLGMGWVDSQFDGVWFWGDLGQDRPQGGIFPSDAGQPHPEKTTTWARLLWTASSSISQCVGGQHSTSGVGG